MKLSPYNTIDEYIIQFPPETKARLQKIREVVRRLAPEVLETIAYGIPTFKLKGKNLVHMAGYEHHIGFYPGSEVIQVFAEQLNIFKTAKGTVQFLLNEPLPITLIEKIVKFRLQALTIRE